MFSRKVLFPQPFCFVNFFRFTIQRGDFDFPEKLVISLWISNKIFLRESSIKPDNISIKITASFNRKVNNRTEKF